MAAVFAARRRCAHKYKKYVIRALSAALAAGALAGCGRGGGLVDVTSCLEGYMGEMDAAAAKP